MGFLLVLAGVLVAITAIRNTYGDLANLLYTDLGDKQLYAWVGAIVAIGLLGYVPKFQTPSRLLLGLVILVLLISNTGVFAQLAQVFTNPPQASPSPPPVGQDLGPLPIKVTIAGGASGLSSLGGLAKAAGDLFGGSSVSSAATFAGSTAAAGI